MNSLKNFYFLNVRDKKRVMTFIIRILKKYQKDRKMIKITDTNKKTNHQSNWLTMTRISLPSRLAFLTSL